MGTELLGEASLANTMPYVYASFSFPGKRKPMNSLIPYTPVQLHAVRLGIVVHALKIIADFPDEKMSRYAKIIMAEDPSEVLDRMNGITRKLEELVSF